MITIRERKSDTLHCFYQAIEIRADNSRVYAKGSNDRWYLIINYNQESPANISPKDIPNEASKMALTLAQSDANWDGEPYERPVGA